MNGRERADWARDELAYWSRNGEPGSWVDDVLPPGSVVLTPDYQDVIRRGFASLTWLVNNAHNNGDPRWNELERAALEDRDAALLAAGGE